MTLRLLTNSDGEAYRALLLRGLTEHPESFRITPADVAAEQVTLTEDDPENFTVGAFADDGMLLGMASFARETREKMRHKGLLYRMYVSSEAAGQGIGRRLVRETLARAGQLPGLEQVTLTVVAANERARQLYFSEGFVPFALERNALKAGDQYFDEEQMAARFVLLR